MFRFFYSESFLENVHLVHVLQLTYKMSSGLLHDVDCHGVMFLKDSSSLIIRMKQSKIVGFSSWTA
jgi:hypothetical protein